MTRRMLKEEAQAWMAGWTALRERERAQLLTESYEDKFTALALLMASVELFDLSSLEAEDSAARARWARLRSTVA